MHYNMEKRFNLIIALIACSYLSGFAQAGGGSIFNFTKMSPSSRISALGGTCVSWMARDINSNLLNPALLNEQQHHFLSAQQLFYFADISFGSFSYAYRLDKIKTNFQASVRYFSTKIPDAKDINGNSLGPSSASEIGSQIMASRKLNERISAGLGIEFVQSNLTLYSSNGILLHGGLHYFNPDKKFGVGLAVRNVGTQLKSYAGVRENISPVQVELGFSKRLKHLPLVYHLQFNNLQTWNVRYDDPAIGQQVDLLGEVKKTSEFSKAIGNVLRHFGFGGELFLNKSESMVIRFGYNHLRSKDLALAEYRAFNGLCFGFGLKIYKFHLDYSYAKYHLAGGSSHLGFHFDLSSFGKQKV